MSTTRILSPEKQLAGARPQKALARDRFEYEQTLYFSKTGGPGAEIVSGYLIVFIFCAMLFGWAAFAPLSSAAIAPGVVSVEGYSKTIQHLEGGIIREIFVNDGDQVKAGQKLVELEKVRVKAEYELIRSQQILAMVREARLVAEEQGDNEISFPASLLDDALRSDPVVQEAMTGQVQVFNKRREMFADQLNIIDQRSAQYESQLRGLKGSAVSQRRQLDIVRNELDVTRGLIKEGLVTRRDVFKLEENEARVDASMKEKYASINSIKQQISELQFQESELKSKQAKEASEELRNVRAELVELTHRLSKARDVLDRNIIRAPIEGVITNLRTHTVGGVIAPGQEILDIVPGSGKLIINASLDPKNRDNVHVGQKAEVRFTAFNRRNTKPVAGRVTTISAESLMDKQSNSPFYLTKIELLEDAEKLLNGESVFPGMQAEVIILTGERTILDYFTDPLMRSFSRALRED